MLLQLFVRQVYKQSKEACIHKIASEAVLLVQVFPDVLVLAALLNLQEDFIEVLVLHSVIGFEFLPTKAVIGIQPKTHRFAVYIYNLAHIAAQKTEVLHKLINIALLLQYTVTIFLGEDVTHPLGWVYQAHHQIHVAADACRKDHWLAFLTEVCKKIVQVFAPVDVEKTLIFLEPKMEVFLASWCQQVSFLVRSEGVSQHFIHLEDYCEFRGICGWREKFWLIEVGLQHTFYQISLIFGFLHHWICLLLRFLIEIKETSCHLNIQSFFDHNLIISTLHFYFQPQPHPPNINDQQKNMKKLKQAQLIMRNNCLLLFAHFIIIFKTNDSFALIRILFDGKAFSRLICSRFLWKADSSTENFSMVETNVNFLSTVQVVPEKDMQEKIEAIKIFTNCLCVDEMKDVLETLDTVAILLALYFVKGNVVPNILIT